MAVQFLPQVQPEYPRNALLEVAGINQGIDSLGNAMRFREQQNYRAAQDAKENARADARLAADSEARRLALEERAQKAAAGVGQAILSLPPEMQGQAWAKTIDSHPNMRGTLTKYGIDINNPAAGAKFLVDMARGPTDPLEEELKRAQIAQAKTRATPDPKFMEVDGTVLRVPAQGPAEEVYKASAPMDRRRAELEKAGVDPASPEGRRYMLTGDMGRSEGMTATDRKAVLSADEDVAAYDSAIANLDRALQINDKVGSGIGTSTIAQVQNTTGFGNDYSRNVAELENILSKEAIADMSATLKGATTDKEMFKFMELAGDVSLDPVVRKGYLERARAKMKRLRDVADRQASEIRGGTYYKPPAGAAANRPSAIDIGDGFSIEVTP